MTTADECPNPFDGMEVYIGRKGLLGLELLRSQDDALRFLLAHPANHAWRVLLDHVTELDTTKPIPPKLIEREL